MIDIGERAGSGIPGVFSVWNKEFGMEPEYSQKISPERTTTVLRLTELVKVNNGPVFRLRFMMTELRFLLLVAYTVL